MRSKEAYLWIGLPFALLCLWLLFFCIPVASQIGDRKGQLAGIEARIARIEAQILQCKEAMAEGSGKATMKSPSDQIPRLDAFPNFMKKIASSVRRGNVTIDRLKGRFDDTNLKASSALAYPVTEMDFTGRFVDIGRVLEQIQTVKAYRRIIRAQLVAAEGIYPDIKGNVEIEFKALRD